MNKFGKKYKEGFTLIELLVVVAIIGLLATMSLVAISEARIRARDVKRKADLKQIKNALEMYNMDNGVYPRAGGCTYGSNCYVYSTSGTSWLSALAPYLAKQPVDPINNANGPWTKGNYSYTYGNVTINGQGFDLIGQLENPLDIDRCELKQYRWKGVVTWAGPSWCGGYSKQIFAPQ